MRLLEAVFLYILESLHYYELFFTIALYVVILIHVYGCVLIVCFTYFFFSCIYIHFR